LLLSLEARRSLVGRVTPECPGLGKFAQLVPDHILGDKHRYMLPAVVNRNREPHKVWRNHRPARPGFDWSLIISVNCVLNMLDQMFVNEWSFL
jgi:hypothetical protein